jgi:ABC-type antimicrobial peptide transport system permease subunit
MTVFVLFVAAGNIANLMAAAAERRGHEMAVSLALGARRWDLLRPRLIEALALAILSCATGLLLAAWTGDLLPSLLGMEEELAGISTRRARVPSPPGSRDGPLIWLSTLHHASRRVPISPPGADATETAGMRRRRGLVKSRCRSRSSAALSVQLSTLGRSGFDAERRRLP